MSRYIALFLTFLFFLSVAIEAAPIVADQKDVEPSDRSERHATSATAQHHWVDMFDNVQPLPIPETSEARSAVSLKGPWVKVTDDRQDESYERQHRHSQTPSLDQSTLREEVSGFQGPFAQFLTSQYGTNLNVTGFYLKGFSCGLISIVAAVAVVTSIYVVVGPWVARQLMRASDYRRAS